MNRFDMLLFLLEHGTASVAPHQMPLINEMIDENDIQIVGKSQDRIHIVMTDEGYENYEYLRGTLH